MKPRTSPDSNPFTTLGLEPTFAVDLPSLERTHRELSRALHPDRYVGAPPAERRSALDRAVLVNEAFRAVKDPLTRAELLFELRGVAVGEGHEPRPSQGFLMDVLEKREALGEAKDARDQAAVASLAKEASEGVARVIGRLVEAFRGGDEARLAESVGLLGELRFFRRFSEEISAVEDELNDAS